MTALRRSLIRRIGCWLLASLVWSALLPGAVAAARMVDGTVPAWGMVCTSQGMRWEPLNTAAASAGNPIDPSDQNDSGPAAAECPLCRLAVALPSLPPRHDDGLVLALTAHDAPCPLTTGPQRPATRHILLNAPPRAPPR